MGLVQQYAYLVLTSWRFNRVWWLLLLFCLRRFLLLFEFELLKKSATFFWLDLSIFLFWVIFPFFMVWSIFNPVAKLFDFFLFLDWRYKRVAFLLIWDFLDYFLKLLFKGQVEDIFLFSFWLRKPGLIIGEFIEYIWIWRSQYSVRVGSHTLYCSTFYILSLSLFALLHLNQMPYGCPAFNDLCWFFFNIHSFGLHIFLILIVLFSVLFFSRLVFFFFFGQGLIFEAERDNFDEIFSNNSEGIVHESELPCYFLSSFFGNRVIDLEVHVTVSHLVRVDILILHNWFWQLTLHFLYNGTVIQKRAPSQQKRHKPLSTSNIKGSSHHIAIKARIRTSNSWREDLHFDIDCFRVFYSAKLGAV